jgi:diguanylate cyclase (GGDEF)-like protein
MDSDNKSADIGRKAPAPTPARWSRKELAQVALLKGAHQESIVPLLRDCPVQSLANGEVLFQPGEPCQALYLVLSGRLRIKRKSSPATETFVRAGDSVGELSLLEDAIVMPTISAAEPTRLLVIHRKVAWALIRSSHEIARNWLALFAERSRLCVIDGDEELKTSHPRGPTGTNDERTGLHNHDWLNAMLPRQISRSTASNAPLGLLLVEIDRFADYAGRWGQAAEDQARRTVAQTLVDNVRPTDLVACYSTAQFVVVLPDSNATNACLIAERVRRAVNRAALELPDKGGLAFLTVSVGVTELQPSADAPAFLAAAETALTMAKTSGGNRVGMR